MKPDTTTTTWEELLAQAAARCDADLDSFVHGAWRAYFDAHPETRAHLEELQLRAQLDELRKNGQIALA